MSLICPFFFFFNDTATTEIYTLSLHDALPIWIQSAGGLVKKQDFRIQRHCPRHARPCHHAAGKRGGEFVRRFRSQDRKSTRLNSSHANISYAVFCLKKTKVYHISRSGDYHALA